MGNFNRDRGFSGGRSDRETFKATCSDCGKFCELPFRPTNGKPVYCRNCFKKHSPEEGRGRDSGRSGDRFSRDNYSRGEREMFDATCVKCGNRCRVPFRPSAGKDIYCSDCFEVKGGDVRKSTNGSAKQLDEINIKLDKILEILSFASEELEKENEEIGQVDELEETIEQPEKPQKKPAVKKPKTKKKPSKKD